MASKKLPNPPSIKELCTGEDESTCGIFLCPGLRISCMPCRIKTIDINNLSSYPLSYCLLSITFTFGLIMTYACLMHFDTIGWRLDTIIIALEISGMYVFYLLLLKWEYNYKLLEEVWRIARALAARDDCEYNEQAPEYSDHLPLTEEAADKLNRNAKKAARKTIEILILVFLGLTIFMEYFTVRRRIFEDGQCTSIGKVHEIHSDVPCWGDYEPKLEWLVCTTLRVNGTDIGCESNGYDAENQTFSATAYLYGKVDLLFNVKCDPALTRPFYIELYYSYLSSNSCNDPSKFDSDSGFEYSMPNGLFNFCIFWITMYVVFSLIIIVWILWLKRKMGQLDIEYPNWVGRFKTSLIDVQRAKESTDATGIDHDYDIEPFIPNLARKPSNKSLYAVSVQSVVISVACIVLMSFARRV